MTGNTELKAYAKKNRVFIWEVAEKFGLSDGTFSRKLRKELTNKEQELFKKYVDEIKATRIEEE